MQICFYSFKQKTCGCFQNIYALNKYLFDILDGRIKRFSQGQVNETARTKAAFPSVWPSVRRLCYLLGAALVMGGNGEARCRR